MEVSIYYSFFEGKFFEGIRNYLDCRVIRKREILKKWCSRPTFKCGRRLTSKLVLAFNRKERVTLSKFPAIGKLRVFIAGTLTHLSLSNFSCGYFGYQVDFLYFNVQISLHRIFYLNS